MGVRKALQLALASWCLFPLAVVAQANLPWQEYSRLIDQGRDVAPLSADGLFGDTVDLYTGALSFSTTDVALPGNNALPVAIVRKLDIYDRKGYGSSGRGHAFADWDIDIPNVHGVFAPDWHDDRCTQAVPPVIQFRVPGDEYWAGNHANLPGGGEMLRVDTSRPQPSSGGPYVWLTEGDTYFSCLPVIANGSGQGFLGIDASGNKYWLDHMAQYGEPSFTHVDNQATPQRFTVQRRKNVLYATRVEDRFGNWVTYSYSNAWNEPVRLTGISSSDGRSLTLQYNTAGFVSSVSDGVRSWTYSYSNNSLSGVLLPDGSSWSMNLADLSSASILPSNDPNDMRTCFQIDFTLSGDVSGSITHPSGATGTFVVGPEDLGRTNVPGICRNYNPPGSPSSDTRDDYPVFPVLWTSLVIRGKNVEGPGVSPLVWAYAFGGGWSWQYPPGQSQPVCQTTTCADPVCLDDSCAGTRSALVSGPEGRWQRFTFGNSYRYNEGKLLMHEEGLGPNAVLRTVKNRYNYATTGQPYEARIGSSPQQRGAGFIAEYPRPLVSKSTLQDGALFTWEVDQGCSSAGVYCMDALARPTQVVRTGVTAGGGSTGPAVPPQATPVLSGPPSSNTGSYVLAWAPVELASHYELQEQLGAGEWVSIQVSGATSAPVDSNPTGVWAYRVRACNNAGCSEWSTFHVVTVTLPPSGSPLITAPASNATGDYSISWTAVADADRYELDQRRDGGAWSRIHDAAGTTKDLAGQAAGAYDFVVRACNAGGCGPDSAPASTTVTLITLGAPVLSAPDSVRQDRPFTVSWNAVTGATSYTVELSDNGAPYVEVYSGGLTSISQSISMTGNYIYRARACVAEGCGPLSYPKSVQVLVGP